MDRLERLVVHIEEGLLLAGKPGEPHQRLALLLLDSAVELMLHRAVQKELNANLWAGRILDNADRAVKAGAVFPDHLLAQHEELRALIPSKRKLQLLDRNFDAKAEYLAEHGELPLAQVRVLRKLHAYRNEAYHRDQVRQGSIRSAVSIYAYLACTMLRDLSVLGPTVSITIPPGLQKYADESAWTSGFDAPRTVAELLLSRSGMAGITDLGRALSEHVMDRLEEVRGGIEEVSAWISREGPDAAWDTQATLALVQADAEDTRPLTPSIAKRLRVPVTAAVLTEIGHRAEALGRIEDPVEAFAEFADLEDALEPVEPHLEQALLGIEAEIQLQTDIARGK